MPLSQTELIQRLLQLNSSDNPYIVTIEGNQVKGMWNLVDAKWLKIIGVSGLKEAYEINILLDESQHEVSYKEHSGSISWSAGIPTLSFQAKYFSGKTKQFSKSIAWGVKPSLEVGKLYDYDFSTSKIKEPMLKIVEDAGWKVKRSFLEKVMGL